MRLEGKVAVITASGSGMGRASARLMAQEGAKVVVADLNPAAGKETVKLIKDAGGEATFVQVDVSRVTDLQRMIKTAVDTYGKLDVLYNHAGTPGPAGIEGVEKEAWEREVAVNLGSGFFGTKYAIPEMRKSGGGSVIFTASTSGMVGSPSSPVYGALKGGVVNLTRSLAVRLGPDNIRVNCICPGATDTPMLMQFFGRPGIKDPEGTAKAFVGSLPISRIGKPEDVGWTAVFLASDESSYITGAIIPVDGGYTAR